jgi:cation transport ATPase
LFMNLATAAPKCTRKSNSRMNNKLLMTWFSVVSVILVLVGAFFAFFGLGVLPVNKDVLLQWESAIYGAIMIGWGATLLYAGRLAFRRNDTELMKILLVGLAAWLIVEALFSLYLGVFFNVGVDIGVLALFSFPLIKAIRERGHG